MCPVTPYAPMYSEPLAGPEKQAEMFAKLAARARPKVSVSGGGGEPHIAPEHHSGRLPDGAKPSPTPPPLIWLDPVPMAPGSAMQHSACKRYRIDGLGSKGDYRFTVWAIRATDMGLNDKLGCVGSGPDARALAEAHRRAQP